LDFDPAGSVFVIFRHAAGTVDPVVAVSSTIQAPDVAPLQVEIQNAVYTAKDNTNQINVTARLSQAVKDGRLVITANNDAMGSDPANLHPKELRVDYTIDGKPGHATVPENQTLTLPQIPSIGQPPTWEISTTNNLPLIKTWANGGVELTTAGGKTLRTETTNLPAPEEINGSWELDFPANWGAPPSINLASLISWLDDTNSGVRYFSGTATYEKEIEISPDRLTDGHELWLDLGAVKNFAEVTLNGQSFGVLWKPPFRVNITAAAKPGANHLTVKVTNLWPNRLIGDEQLPDDREWDGDRLKEWPQWLLDGKPSPTGRLTFTTWHHWHKDSMLLPSGLLGPVELESAEIKTVKFGD
jgi:hypothetical protein